MLFRSVQASGISGDIVLVLEALVLFCIASEFIPALKRVLPGWLRLTPLRAANSSAAGAPVAASNAVLENAREVAGQREKVAIDVAARETADESAGGESTGAREE